MRSIRLALLASLLFAPGCAVQPASDTSTTQPSEPSDSDEAGTWQVDSGNNLSILLSTKTGKTWTWNGAMWIPMDRASQ
jgi:hypothetical protein